MIRPKVGFVVYGVHKDGLLNPLGERFIDERLVEAARAALEKAGLELVVYDLVIASRQEARVCLAAYKKMDDLDAQVLFSGYTESMDRRRGRIPASSPVPNRLSEYFRNCDRIHRRCFMSSGKGTLFSGSALAIGSFSLLQAKTVFPWWAWVLLLIILVILFYLVIRGGRTKEAAAPAVEKTEVIPELEPQPVVVTPDDLTVIEGIGPKINQFLQDAEIKTFTQLAAVDAGELDKMLANAGLRLANPATWAEQARLAAAGDWEGLQKLQDTLKGGLRK